MFYFYIALSAVVDFLICFFTEFIWWKALILFPFLFIAFLIIHLIMFCFFSLFVREKQTKNINNFHRKFMLISLKLFFKIGLVKVSVVGKEKLPEDKRFLFVCNHISSFDPIITIVELAEYNLGFVSKKENLEVPFAGKYMIKSGCIGLDRDNNRSAATAINQASQNIADNICSMGIYPEGYVNKNVGELLEFRNGAFKIAKKAKCDIAVAVIKNTREVNRKIFRKKTNVTLIIKEVIPYAEIEKLKTNEIGERVRSIMTEGVGL